MCYTSSEMLTEGRLHVLLYSVILYNAAKGDLVFGVKEKIAVSVRIAP